MNSQFYQKIFLLSFSLTNASSINETDVQNDYELNTYERIYHKKLEFILADMQTRLKKSNDTVKGPYEISFLGLVRDRKLLYMCLRFLFSGFCFFISVLFFCKFLQSESIEESFFYCFLVIVFVLLYFAVYDKCKEMALFINSTW